MRRRDTALVVLAVVIGAATAGAYVLNGPKWGIQQVPYYINPANNDVPEADAIAAIQTAALAWTGQSHANILLYYMGRTSGSSLTKNGKNEVFLRNTSAGGIVGETYWWYDSSYRLVEADIVLYDGDYRFFTGSSGCASGLYLEDIATHEFGHALGLGHSSVSSASMFPSLGWCTTSVRTLDPDDLAGIETLYPGGGSHSNTAPTVTISTPLNGSLVAEATSVTFSGSASDGEDGNLGSGLVWSSSQDGQIGTGTSFQQVLSVGTHTITARVTDSQGASAEATRTVTVEPISSPTLSEAFTLTGRGYKVKGSQRVDLGWSGATSSSVNVHRNGTRVATTDNTGRYTDRINRKGGGTYTYVVCEAGTSRCSNQITITF